jgi:hypothetical protein
MIFGGMATPEYLHLSMFLAYATLYPDAQFLLFFFIPVRAWILAIVDLALTLYGLIFYPFPINFFGVIALANYFLFFGGDIINVLPPSLRRKLMNKRRNQPAKFVTIPFTKAKAAEKENAPYHHRCTVCGRTDLTDPNMEFRYCSRCNGYYCYCQEHIRNHSHIE